MVIGKQNTQQSASFCQDSGISTTEGGGDDVARVFPSAYLLTHRLMTGDVCENADADFLGEERGEDILQKT